MGTVVVFTLGSDTSCDERMCGVVGSAVGVTHGSIASSDGRGMGLWLQTLEPPFVVMCN